MHYQPTYLQPTFHTPEYYHQYSLPSVNQGWVPGSGYNQYSGPRFNPTWQGTGGNVNTSYPGNVNPTGNYSTNGSNTHGYYNALTINAGNKPASESVSTPVTSSAQSPGGVPDVTASGAVGSSAATPQDMPDLQNLDPNLSETIEDIASSMASNGTKPRDTSAMSSME